MTFVGTVLYFGTNETKILVPVSDLNGIGLKNQWGIFVLVWYDQILCFQNICLMWQNYELMCWILGGLNILEDSSAETEMDLSSIFYSLYFLHDKKSHAYKQGL